MYTLVLSDLHLGNGREYDTFAGEAVLPRVLAEAAAARASVVLNGDSFDFLMNDDPLELDERRAVEQTRAITRNPASQAALAGLGRVLQAGGAVDIRLGNHDAELALSSVQAELRAALAQPPDIAARLQFSRNDEPGRLDVGGAVILLAHGEHNDPWNRLDYTHLADEEARDFVYPPGSRLVKTLLNPLKSRFGMRFADLLKPDFHGAVLTALAVDPGALSVVFKGSTTQLLWQLFRRTGQAMTFVGDESDEDLGLAAAIAAAGLDEDEIAALEAAIDPAAPQSFADEGILASARNRLARAGLRLYAAAQRALAGPSGDTFFSLAPDDGEWAEARRLADKFGADAVVLGHTHAARFRCEADLTYVNTGTWIYLMRLPPADAPADAWAEFLELCRRNPRLDPALGPAPPLTTRLTGLVVDPHPDGGARLRLCEYTERGSETLAEGRVRGRS